jgi:hypothetical protein
MNDTEPKLEQWQIDRMNFYTKSGVLKFIDDYFNVKKGTRCIVGHVKDMYDLHRQPTYRIYHNNMCRAQTIPDAITRNHSALLEYWTVHSYMYVFDKRVLEWTNLENRKDIMKESLVGINAVIELDSPEDKNSDKAKRTSFFNYVPEFNDAISIIDKRLTELGEDYNLMFSGNGIYLTLEGYYDDSLNDYVDNFINLNDNLRESGLGDNLKVHIDNRAAPWNDYFKTPFTFHEKRPRVSIPLPKEELNKNWIKFVSDVNNISQDYSIVNEIIKKASWRKLW